MIIDKIEECICKGDKEELDIIFNDNTIDCNIMLSSNQTPLIKSVISEHYDLVLYFLKKKVFIDIQDKDGMTALMHASKNGSAIYT